MSARSVSSVLERTAAEGRAALVGYLPVGFPTLSQSIAALRAMVEAGVDIVEVGVPYSDPVIDGPTIQTAANTALAAGVRVHDVFPAVEAVAEAGAPALVMTYWNLVEKYGVSRFAADLAAAGGAGLITPDLLPEEADEWRVASDEHGLDRVFLVAPSSTPERIELTADASRGFLYATAVMGVTGAREASSADAPGLVSRVRQATKLPVGVGLGVSTGAQAAEVGAYADAVIVGSALVRQLMDVPDFETGLANLRGLVGELADGVRQARR